MIKKHIIEEALQKHWNLKPAADALGIGYSTLRKYIKAHGIEHNSRKAQNGGSFDRREYSRKVVQRARRKKKLQALEYRGGMKCSRCGFDEQIPDCYAFHHRNPVEKDPNWGKMKANNWPFEKIKVELDKCDIVCHNCHSIIHWEERH